MLAYIMIAILAVLAFLCMSHVIPSLARRKVPAGYRSQTGRTGSVLK